MNAETKVSIQTAPAPAPPEPKVLRRILMGVIPVVLVAGGIGWYLQTGRFVGTDNAYVKADIASISPEIAGNIQEVFATENQVVTKGQPLLKVDDTTYQIMKVGADAQVRSAVAGVEADKSRYRQKEASIAIMQGNVAFADREYKRQSTLAANNFAAAAKLDEAKHALDAARQNIALLKQEEAEILTRLEGDPNVAPEKVPSYLQALSGKISAETYIKKATVYAPFDGVVSQVPKVGDFARTAAPAMSIVSNGEVWIEANFKETDLTHMTVGQPVEIRVDAYPGRTFAGHVTSISQASGAEFSILPAQNSTGNWVKVVQRIPVRISVDDQKAGPALRAGMSVVADVDTGHNRFEQYFGAAK